MHEQPHFEKSTVDDIRERMEKKSSLSDYSFEGYCDSLHLNGQDFPRKTILDLGSGKYENFSREATKLGATVISLNPKLAETETRQDVRDMPDWQGMSVAGRAQELPFKDASFDTIVSYWAIPGWVPQDTREFYEKEMELIIDECLRVLKPGGKIALSPIVYRDTWSDDQILEMNLGQEKYQWLKCQKIGIQLLDVSKRKNGAIILYKPSEKEGQEL